MKKIKKVNSVGIIIDGNRRWAVKNGMGKLEGHQYGLERVLETIECARDLGIKELTFYIFSTENWNRSKIEVRALMTLFQEVFENKIREIDFEKFEISFIGSLYKFPKKLQKIISEVEAESKEKKGKNKMKVYFAASYGGRTEIIDAIKEMNSFFSKKEIENLTERKFEKFLSSGKISEPEIIIRTGGDKRLSNFLLWKSAYSELYFIKKLWPEFKKKDLEKIIEDYQESRINKGK